MRAASCSVCCAALRYHTGRRRGVADCNGGLVRCACVVGRIRAGRLRASGSGGGADNNKALAELVAAQDKQIQLMADQIALLKRAALQ